MKKKNNFTIEEFIEKYDELKKQIAILKSKRRDVLKIAKALAKAANKLCKIGDKNFYIDTETGLQPISKKLPKIMDDLEFWRTIDIEFTI